MEKKIPTEQELKQMIKEKHHQIKVAEEKTKEQSEKLDWIYNAKMDAADRVEYYKKQLQCASVLLGFYEEGFEATLQTVDEMLLIESNLKSEAKKLVAQLQKTNQKGE